MTGLLTNTNNYYSTFANWLSSQQRGGTIGLDGKLFKLDVNHNYLPPNLDINKILENPPVIDLKDVNFGYHPLLPLYMILSSFFYSIDPDLLEDTFYDAYIKYYHFLCFMVDDIITQINQNKILQAYLIGFALKAFLFNPTLISDQPNDYYDVINQTFIGSGYKIDINTNYDYRMMLLTNSSFSNYISGTIYVTNHEYNFEKTLFNLDIVKGFLIENYAKAYKPPLHRAPQPPPPPFSPPRSTGNTTSPLTPQSQTQTSPSSEVQHSASPLDVGPVGTNCADLAIGASFNNLRKHIFKLLARINNVVNPSNPGPSSFIPGSQSPATGSAASSDASPPARPGDGTRLFSLSPAPPPKTTPAEAQQRQGLVDIVNRKTNVHTDLIFAEYDYMLANNEDVNNLEKQISVVYPDLIQVLRDLNGKGVSPEYVFGLFENLDNFKNGENKMMMLIDATDYISSKKLPVADIWEKCKNVLTGFFNNQQPNLDTFKGELDYCVAGYMGGKRKTRKQQRRKITKTKRKQNRKGAKKTRKRRKTGNKNKSKRR